MTEAHPGIRFKFEVECTGEPVFVPEDAVIRLLCHIFIERLPAPAIADVWASIHDAWEWHSRPRVSPRPVDRLPGSMAVDRVFGVVEEPPFRIAED